MKIIALGDTHGRNLWKSVANTQQFDKLVFIGDYFDSPDISATDQVSNFRDIIDYKKANPDKIILLTGNHDFHYLPVAMENFEVYTGFQEIHALQISLLVCANLNLLQACYQWENYLFSHAGVTNTWLKNAGYKGGQADLFINELFDYTPRRFFFTGSNPYGDNVTQSPIWVRPASLKKNAYNYEHTKQVVGHTRVTSLEIVKNRYFFIDTLGSSKEYLVIEDGVARVEKMMIPN